MDNALRKAQNVVLMSDYQTDTRFAPVAQVEAYWDALRSGRKLPRRSDIDPRGIELALENAFILERVAVGVARIRVAGSHLTTLMGMEVRGMPITCFFSPAYRDQISGVLEEMFQHPATASLSLTAPAARGRPALDARMALLPLTSDLGDVSRALGCLVTRGDVGTTPRRFDVAHQQIDILRGTAPVMRPAPAPTPVHSLSDIPETSGFEEAPAPYRGTPAPKRPPYLRVVKSDE